MGSGKRDSVHDKDCQNNDDDLHNLSPTTVSRNNSESGIPGAVFNLTTTIIGAGIMSLPATMKVLGLISGVLMILLMGVLSEISLELLVRFTVQCQATSYGEVVKQALGSPGKLLSEICIVLNNAGILLVYLIIIGDVMSGSSRHAGVLEQWFGTGFWTDRKIIIFIVLLVFLAPLCALNRIDSLSFTSAASVILAVLFVIIACAITSVLLVKVKIDRPRLLPDFTSKESIVDLLVVIPIMSNAYVCHFNAQPIYNELENRSPKKMNKIGRMTTVICVLIYWSTAISGYLLFGKNTEPDVLTNFDKPLPVRFSLILNHIVRVGYILHLILVFPVIHFSLRQTINALVFKDEPLTKNKKRSLGLTCGILAVIYIGSTMIPSIWTAFKFTGATTAVSLGFTFPALIGLRLGSKVDPGLTRREKGFCWLMLVLAIIVCLVGIAGNIYGLV